MISEAREHTWGIDTNKINNFVQQTVNEIDILIGAEKIDCAAGNSHFSLSETLKKKTKQRSINGWLSGESSFAEKFETPPNQPTATRGKFINQTVDCCGMKDHYREATTTFNEVEEA